MTSFFKWMLPSMDKYIYERCQAPMYSLSINLTIGGWQSYLPVWRHI